MRTRGYRNNNPGNIRRNADRFQGEIYPSRDLSFKQFETMIYGYRAIMCTLRTYQRKYHLFTIRGMIRRWAPPQENNVTKYIYTVAHRMGIKADQRINVMERETMLPLVAAISYVENGCEPDERLIQDAWNLFN